MISAWSSGSVDACMVALALAGMASAQGTTTRVSVDSAGIEGNGMSWYCALSPGARHVTFMSYATNLVPGDTNGMPDIFVRDRQSGQTTRVSVDSAGIQANSDNREPWISADGRYVVFESGATNLVPNDTNGMRDIFVHDCQSGQTTLASVGSTGSQGNGSSLHPRISADGRFVGFQSAATNFAPGDTNGTQDVFVHDRLSGNTTRVSVSSTGVQGNKHSFGAAFSADGRFVGFGSHSTNLVPGDLNATIDAFVHDRISAQTWRVSVDSSGFEGNGESGAPALSADGRFAAFSSQATNLVPDDTNLYEDVFVRDLQTGVTERVSVGHLPGQEADLESHSPVISDDGRYVAFTSLATNLVSGDSNGKGDIFVRDRLAGTNKRVSVDSAGSQPNDESLSPTLSADGSHVAFYSRASNLVAGDNNGFIDDFVHDECPVTAVYCTPKPNSLGCLPAIASTGCSSASNTRGFQISADRVRNGKAGLLLYGVNGRAAAPFQNGTLCIASPVKRAVGVNAGGTPAPANDCSGTFSLDMNAFAGGALGGHPTPALRIPGTVVDCQWWGRDPGFAPPNDTTLSDALEYVVGS